MSNAKKLPKPKRAKTRGLDVADLPGRFQVELLEYDRGKRTLAQLSPELVRLIIKHRGRLSNGE
jgi:hypothetical protein